MAILGRGAVSDERGLPVAFGRALPPETNVEIEGRPKVKGSFVKFRKESHLHQLKNGGCQVELLEVYLQSEAFSSDQVRPQKDRLSPDRKDPQS